MSKRTAWRYSTSRHLGVPLPGPEDRSERERPECSEDHEVPDRPEADEAQVGDAADCRCLVLRGRAPEAIAAARWWSIRQRCANRDRRRLTAPLVVQSMASPETATLRLVVLGRHGLRRGRRRVAHEKHRAAHRADVHVRPDRRSAAVADDLESAVVHRIHVLAARCARPERRLCTTPYARYARAECSRTWQPRRSSASTPGTGQSRRSPDRSSRSRRAHT